MVVCGMLRLDDGLKCLRRAKMAASGSREIIHNAAKLVCCMEGASELASHTGLLKQDLDLTTKLMQDISGLAALEALFVAHDLPYNLYRVLVQASQLVEISAIDQGQAIQVVDVCERTRCSFDEAIAELGLGIYEANDEDVTQDQVAKPASRPRLLDGSSAMQLLFYFCAALAAVAVIHYQLLPQFHVLAMVVVSSVLLTFSASTLDGAFKRCRKEAYEQEVNSEAAVLTKDKLKTLRTSQRLSRF